MTPLFAELARRIAQSGPISLAEFMATALGHPEHGYYTSHDAIGRAGDFITAPEISQMFGELIGLWTADLWQRAGQPPLTVTELGPGHGTLMSDATRALHGIPGAADHLAVHLVEISPVLRQRQRQTLPNIDVTWHNDLATLPLGPIYFIANEFYDALPSRQFIRREDGWHERLVGCLEHILEFRDGPLTHPPVDAAILTPAQPGDIVEYSPDRISHATALAQRLTEQGGAALIIDYGPEKSTLGDSLQAIIAHQPSDPLDQPGQADLTTHVDFASLATTAAAQGAKTYGPITQRAFLRTLGIELRARTLLNTAPPSQHRHIASALNRLIAPDQMGTLFKVLAITHPDMPAPAGFA